MHRIRGWLSDNGPALQSRRQQIVVLFWLAVAIGFIINRWGAIHWFALGDTDDNMRYLQVRDWLGGQGWYDLRQHRLNPPEGANIHWSRLVDLPIAALILLFRPFAGQLMAEKLAVGFAPLIPLLPTMLCTATLARRAGPAWSWVPGAVLVLGAGMTMGMYMPERIDHHGWQLALALLIPLGLTDRERLRGGLIAGIGSALSFVIGLEMIPYLALGGGVLVLLWLLDGEERPRLRGYALALGGGIALGYLIFASYDNRVPRCDALSPVWLSACLLASALLLPLGVLPVRRWPARLGLAALAGAILVAFMKLAWPDCLHGAYYTIPPELQRLWLANIREAKPLIVMKPHEIATMAAMPVAAILGSLIGAWITRRRPEVLRIWLIFLLFCLASSALLFWQIRAAPAAQLFAVPPLAAIGAMAVVGYGRLPTAKRILLLIGLLIVAGAALSYQLRPIVHPTVKSKAQRKLDRASASCHTLPSLAPVAKLPAATIFTLADLSPRLIAVTHHRAIAGPYHRNAEAILDVHHAFDGPAAKFRTIAGRHGATLLLICPAMAEGRIYASRSPKGFYADLLQGDVPDWLTPVELPKTSPLKLWRITYGKDVRLPEKKARSSAAESPSPRPE